MAHFKYSTLTSTPTPTATSTSTGGLNIRDILAGLIGGTLTPEQGQQQAGKMVGLPPPLAPPPPPPVKPGGGGPGSQEVIGWTPDGKPIIAGPGGTPIVAPVTPPPPPPPPAPAPASAPAPAPAPAPVPVPAPVPDPPTVAPIGEDEGEEEGGEDAPLSPTEQAAQLLFGAVRNNPFITPEGRTNLEQGLAPLLNQINPAFWRYTSPTIIKSLESLFRSLGLLTDDLRFTIGSRRPTALR